MHAVPVDDLPVGGAPRPRLQGVDDPASFGQFREPLGQHARRNRAEEREHQSFAPERRIVTGDVRREESHRAACEVAVGHGLRRSVGSPELAERVDLDVGTEDLAVKGEGLAGGAR